MFSMLLVLGGCQRDGSTESEAQPPTKQDKSENTEGAADSKCPVRAGSGSLEFDIDITDGELREPRPEEHPNKVKERIAEQLEYLRDDETGLSCQAEHNLETHFQVADAYYADGRLETAWLILHNVEQMLVSMKAARRGNSEKVGHVESEEDLLSYRDLRNVHVITSNYMTGAQPSRQGYRWLKENGVTDVVTLRTATDHEKQMVEEMGMNFRELGWPDEEAPDEKQVDEVLNTIEQADGKVFQHCLRGIGRDMTMASLVKIHQGKDVEKVLEHGRETSPTWAADQERSENGEPVQFQFIRQYAEENL